MISNAVKSSACSAVKAALRMQTNGAKGLREMAKERLKKIVEHFKLKKK